MASVVSRALRLPKVTAIVMAGTVTAGCTVLAPVLGGDALPGAAPTCSWPLRVTGHATATQAGLIQCYLQAVAHHDLGALEGLANPAYQVTGAELTQTADARAGLATATVSMSPDDAGIGTVQIDYADGATSSFGIEIVNPQVARSWRLDIGR